jgi:AcrR family transcriptional regulator
LGESAAPKKLTPKGAGTAARLLEAATVVLARDGFGGATLGRIADEADLDKRNILYYFPSREALLVHVVRDVGEKIAATIAAADSASSDPEAVAATTVDALWSGATSAPMHARAYFALIGGCPGTPVVEDALEHIKHSFLIAIATRLDAIDESHWHLRADPAVVASFTFAVLRGLHLEWTESGDSPEIDIGLARMKRALAAEFVAAPSK